MPYAAGLNRPKRWAECIRRRRATPALWALYGLLALPWARAGEEPGGAHFGRTVARIEYRADPPLERAHYDPHIGLRPGDTLTRTALKGAIQFLHDSGRFSSIAAEAFPEGDGILLRFVLGHNYYFNRFLLEGDFDLRGRSLGEWVPLPVGKRYTGEELRKSREAVLAFFKGRGHYLARVEAHTAWDGEARQVDVVYRVEPGELARLRSVSLRGVPEQDAADVLGLFGFREGSRFERSQLADRMETLRNHFLDRGHLAVVTEAFERFDPETNTVALELIVYNYAAIRVLVDGYRIDRNRMQGLMAVLSRAGDRDAFLREGADTLREYLEDRGYPEATVTALEGDDDGVYLLRYRIEPGRRRTVASVRFEGCGAVPDRERIEAVRLRPSSFLDSSVFSDRLLGEGADALEALYASRGHLAADVVYRYEPSGNRGRYDVVYSCTEGPRARIHSVAFDGNASLGTGLLLSATGLGPGEPYAPAIAEQGRQALLAAYSDAGHLQARVTMRADRVDALDAYSVHYQIDEGTRFVVDRIVVLGNEHTRRSVIDRRLRIRTGDPLSLGKLLETQQALYRLGIFDQVRVGQQNPESTNPHQNVVIRLRESKRFTVRYGIGYAEEENLRGTLEFADLNILGTARRADIRLRGSSREQKAVFNLRQSQFQPLPVDSYLSLSASYEQGNFDIRRLGASYQFSQPLSSHSWGLLRYNFQNVKSLNLNVSDPEYDREDTPRNLSTFSVGYVNDSRDNYLDPAEGFFSSTDLGLTTRLLGDNDYLSFFTQNSYYRRLPKSFLTAVSLRLGVLRPWGGSNVPISERFFAGGASSLRGFDTDFAGPLVAKEKVSEGDTAYTPVGGNALVVGSVELRRPILSYVHLAGFYDAGNVFRDFEDIARSGFSHTVGAGLRVKTPFGPLRFDYGINLNLPPELRAGGLSRGHLFITVGPPF